MYMCYADENFLFGRGLLTRGLQFTWNTKITSVHDDISNLVDQ